MGAFIKIWSRALDHCNGYIAYCSIGFNAKMEFLCMTEKAATQKDNG